jgi:hypothetical protein
MKSNRTKMKTVRIKVADLEKIANTNTAHYDTLPPDLAERDFRLWKRLGRFQSNITYKKWNHITRCNLMPQREIAILENIVAVMDEYRTRWSGSESEIYWLLLQISIGADLPQRHPVPLLTSMLRKQYKEHPLPAIPGVDEGEDQFGITLFPAVENDCPTEHPLGEGQSRVNFIPPPSRN